MLSAEYASDGPISRPINGESLTVDVEMGGFGWSAEQGLFIPTDGEIEHWQPPYDDAEYLS